MADDARRFFDEFARAAAGSDAEDLAGFYDEGVVHATPASSQAFLNDAKHRKWLAARLADDRQHGLTELHAVDVGSYDVGSLAGSPPAFLIATVRWRARFETGEPVEWTTTYLLRRAADGLRLTCSAAPEEPVDMLRRAGARQRPGPGEPRKGRSASARTKPLAADRRRAS
jgi:hypothetical protein